MIGIVLGSTSDLPQIEGGCDALKKLDVPFEVRILSAHRTPRESHEYAATAKERGLKAIIAVAGMAAHLAGVLAATAEVPVLGVPADGGALRGLDALLSTVQMPGGVPVATFGIGKAGATNAALFACRMLSLEDETLARKLADYREAMRKKILDSKIDL
ncbi:MAG: 5-(carboxyamino)imidazole ribonucleotide mutase [Planctomycetota bacterium]|jgi:phosphoribosylaminoimidazole carboxylase PurE protein